MWVVLLFVHLSAINDGTLSTCIMHGTRKDKYVYDPTSCDASNMLEWPLAHSARTSSPEFSFVRATQLA